MMDRCSGCGPCPWSCSGKVGAYGISIGILVFLTKVLYLFHWLVPRLRFGILFFCIHALSLICLIIGPSDKCSFILHIGLAV